MKIIGTFAVVVVASVALLQPAQGRSHGGGRSFSSAPHFSASAGNFSGHSRSLSNSAPRYYHSSPRFSSRAVYRNRTSGPRFSANRTTAHYPRTYSASNARLATTRRAALRPQTFNGSGGRVLARHTLNWDRGRDHFWNGHRCRWHHNSWVIIDPWYPWAYGYGYYPYAPYSYYYGDSYDNGYASGDDSQSEYGNADSIVSQVQAALAREGYYRGAIDGSFGPATQNALRRYQRNHALEVTGRIGRPVMEALGLG